MTSSDRIDPAGDEALAHCSPPSVVSHSPVPNTKPCDGVANLMPHTAAAGPFSGWPSGTTGAGSPRQLAPRFSVRTIDVHGVCEHGAVPSTNASSGETNVTEVAAIPAGTGPPAGVAAPPVPCPVAVRRARRRRWRRRRGRGRRGAAAAARPAGVLRPAAGQRQRRRGHQRAKENRGP